MLRVRKGNSAAAVPRPKPGRGRLFLLVQLVLAILFVLLLVRLAFPSERPIVPEKPPGFVYRVEPDEWGRTNQTLRQIHERYGMDPDELAATLAANAAAGQCADPDRRLGFGDEVLIALSQAGGEKCQEAAAAAGQDPPTF